MVEYKAENEVKQNLIQNITCTMTDRAVVNHATISKLNVMWNTKLIETNCHLHPLDSMANKVKEALSSSQETDGECLAAITIHKLSKLRFKDNRGDPKGFKMFLESKNLPLSLLPRYVGNLLLCNECFIFDRRNSNDSP